MKKRIAIQGLDTRRKTTQYKPLTETMLYNYFTDERKIRLGVLVKILTVNPWHRLHISKFHINNNLL